MKKIRMIKIRRFQVEKRAKLSKCQNDPCKQSKLYNLQMFLSRRTHFLGHLPGEGETVPDVSLMDR